MTHSITNLSPHLLLATLANNLYHPNFSLPLSTPKSVCDNRRSSVWMKNVVCCRSNTPHTTNKLICFGLKKGPTTNSLIFFRSKKGLTPNSLIFFRLKKGLTANSLVCSRLKQGLAAIKLICPLLRKGPTENEYFSLNININ